MPKSSIGNCKQTLPPDKWFCEEYRPHDKMVAPRPGVKVKSSSTTVNQNNLGFNSFQSVENDIFPRNAEIEVPSEVPRIKKIAKVRFLPTEDAINLNSGSKAVAQVTHRNQGFLTTSPDHLSAICKSTEVLGKNATSNSSLLTVTTNSLALHGMRTSALQQQAVEMSDSLAAEDHPPGFPSKKYAIGSVAITKEAGDRVSEPVALTVHTGLGSRWSVMKIKETRGEEGGLIPRRGSVPDGQSDVAIFKKAKASNVAENLDSYSATVPSLNVKPLTISSSGINFPSGPSSRSDTVHERNLQKISLESQRQPLSGPALEVIWKGSFEVKFQGDNEIFEGLLAHLSAKISRKAYEFARQIAGVLQFRIHPRRAFWPEIFQFDCPDANDIALFFYPEKTKRSRRHYAFLLKLIEKQDLMLRSLMGRVELLVFPSKLLHVDSQKLDGSYFMWGVFHDMMGKKVAYKAEALPCLPVLAGHLMLSQGQTLQGIE